MVGIATAVGVGTAGAGIFGSILQANAASDATDAQVQASRESLAEQQRQFDAIQKLMAPYVSAGTGALGQMQDLMGLGNPGAQQQAINAIRDSDLFQSMLAQGEESLMRAASATGGYRGGNAAAQLAQFSPQLLNSLVQQRLGQLGGLAGMGQSAAAGQAGMGMQFGGQQASLLQGMGDARARNSMAQGAAIASPFNMLAGLGGKFLGAAAQQKGKSLFGESKGSG